MPVPVISIDQMREWEAATWATGVTEGEVIAQVGRAIATRALELTKPDDSILIVAGKGHNGDDARAAIPHLLQRHTKCIDASDPRAALREIESSSAKACSLVIDGLFGIGLNRPLDHACQTLIAAINQLGIPILSVDVPSGWNAALGRSEGSVIRASLTMTVGAPKTGLLAGPAAEFVGRLEVLENVGLVPCSATSDLQWILARDFTGSPPPRQVTAHKGSFGHVAVFAGSLGYHGAAVLAARAALRAQVGLVSVFTDERVYIPVATQLQQPMVHPWSAGQTVPANCSAVAFGPGLAASDLPQSLKSELVTLWRDCPLPVICDASALHWLPDGSTAPAAVRVMTPHPGEAARMLQVNTQDVNQNRVAALRRLSAKYGNCCVVLKGHQTLIGRSTGDVFINSSGNPHLAQGGSGDVLLGYLAGLLAQPPLQVDPVRTTSFAVWQHGATADRLARHSKNWTLEEFIVQLGMC